VQAIVQALTAGSSYGDRVRGNRVRNATELLSRLAEDGQRLGDDVVFAALAALISEGRVVQRPGYGIELSRPTRRLWAADSDPTDLSKLDGPSWGPGEPWRLSSG
jgi:hypothetical protein